MAMLVLLSTTLIWIAGEASAATIEVKKDGTGDSTTIQGGIDMANAGDTVLVYDSSWDLGTYSDGTPALTIPSDKTGLLFKGVGSGRVFVYASAYGGSEDSQNYVLHIAADEVTMENFRIRNNVDTNYASGVKVSGDDVTFDNLSVELERYYSIHSITITGTTGFTIKDSQWHSTESIYHGYAGLYGIGVGDVTFEGTNQIDENFDGVYLNGNGTLVIRGELTGSASSYFSGFDSLDLLGKNKLSTVTITGIDDLSITGQEFVGADSLTINNADTTRQHC